jgi:Na+:H+ antiporter
MDTASSIFFVGLLIFLAHLFTGLFSRTKIPDVLLLMLIGLLIGPCLGIVNIENFGAASA